VHRMMVGNPEGKSPLGRPRYKWENNIKMDVQEARRRRGDGMDLAQDRNRRRPIEGTINARNFLTSLLVSFSRRALLHGVSKKVKLHSILQENCTLCVYCPGHSF
jgi:hypothetical protein